MNNQNRVVWMMLAVFIIIVIVLVLLSYATSVDAAPEYQPTPTSAPDDICFEDPSACDYNYLPVIMVPGD